MMNTCGEHDDAPQETMGTSFLLVMTQLVCHHHGLWHGLWQLVMIQLVYHHHSLWQGHPLSLA